MYYQSSSEIQADGLRTLYLMNPNLVGYSDSYHHHHHHAGQSYQNAAAGTVHALSSVLIPHAPLPQFVDGGASAPPSHDHIRPSPLLEGILAVAQSSSSVPRVPYNLWGLPDNGINQPNTPLSLTLSAAGFDKPLIPYQSTAGIILSKNCSSSPCDQSDGHNNAVILSSKYVKAAQELLDQVVNVVEKDTKIDHQTKDKDKAKVRSKGSADNAAVGSKTDELTPSQRQEILLKKAKLHTMLDEVDGRYRQYQQQMQALVTSFEQVAGGGSARSYTQVALRTILKQFRWLRRTISGQIKSLNRSLAGPAGELESESGLRLVDNQVRQHRALQQLGMMQTTAAWRPQRGLPERAVAVLRAWLFEHFLHPYPKDSDKHMLAKQTGLTRSQVSNWFINARVRLWKPMVEEMYVEEMKTHNPNSDDVVNPSSKIITNTLQQVDKDPNLAADKLPPPHHHHLVETLSAKKPRRQDMNSPTTIITAPAYGNICQQQQQQLAMPGMGSMSNNYFSLSLGLPLPGGQISFMSPSRNFQFDNQEGNSHSNLSYEILDFQNRKAAQPHPQLLPDFVA